MGGGGERRKEERREEEEVLGNEIKTKKCAQPTNIFCNRSTIRISLRTATNISNTVTATVTYFCMSAVSVSTYDDQQRFSNLLNTKMQCTCTFLRLCTLTHPHTQVYTHGIA